MTAETTPAHSGQEVKDPVMPPLQDQDPSSEDSDVSASEEIKNDSDDDDLMDCESSRLLDDISILPRGIPLVNQKERKLESEHSTGSSASRLLINLINTRGPNTFGPTKCGQFIGGLGQL